MSALPASWTIAASATLAVAAWAGAAVLWTGHRERAATRARLLARPRHVPARDVFVGALRSDEQLPAWRQWIVSVLEQLVPARLRGPDVAERVAEAGLFSAEATLLFAAARMFAPVVAPMLALAVAGMNGPVLTIALLAGIAGPSATIDKLTGARRRALRQAIPDALDLIVICLEAGLGLDAALVRVTRELGSTYPALAEELAQVTRRTAAGLPREEALQALVDRTKLDELRSIVTTIIQVERLGSSLSGVLRVHASTMRERRKQGAEKRAAELTVKMVLPLVMFLLPAFFAVVLGPAVLAMLSTTIGP